MEGNSVRYRVDLGGGAGIETKNQHEFASTVLSRSAWARGLKRALDIDNMYKDDVALRVGAWIETTNFEP